jgi:hypothetical protein
MIQSIDCTCKNLFSTENKDLDHGGAVFGQIEGERRECGELLVALVLCFPKQWKRVRDWWMGFVTERKGNGMISLLTCFLKINELEILVAWEVLCWLCDIEFWHGFGECSIVVVVTEREKMKKRKLLLMLWDKWKVGEDSV